MASPAARLIVLDRDGVINHDSDAFIKSPAEWVPIDGSMEAIALLTKSGFTVAVASNQSGVGRQLLDRHALNAIHQKMRRAAARCGGTIDRIVYCPHLPADNCACRKPAPGLLNSLAKHYGVSMRDVPVVGDSARDLEAARAVEARPILVLTGNGRTTKRQLAKRRIGVEVYDNLLAAARALVAEQRDSDGLKAGLERNNTRRRR
jgi:D-glycero-D-manno-heptose 1,7-bisphosphate phosphatase